MKLEALQGDERLMLSRMRLHYIGLLEMVDRMLAEVALTPGGSEPPRPRAALKGGPTAGRTAGGGMEAELGGATGPTRG